MESVINSVYLVLNEQQFSLVTFSILATKEINYKIFLQDELLHYFVVQYFIMQSPVAETCEACLSWYCKDLYQVLLVPLPTLESRI